MIVGMSETRLARIGAHIEKYIEAGKLPCASVLITRDMDEAYYFASGLRRR